MPTNPPKPRARTRTHARARPGVARTDVMRETISATVASSPELQTETVAFVRELLRDIHRTILIGDPAAKATLIKAVIPELLKQSVTHDDTEDRLRAEYLEVLREVRGESPET